MNLLHPDLGYLHRLITGGVPSRSMPKPLVDDAITTILIICRGASMLFYRAALPLSARTLNWGSCCLLLYYREWFPAPGSDGDAVGERDGECIHGRFPAVSACSAFSSFADQPVAVDMPSGDISDLASDTGQTTVAAPGSRRRRGHADGGIPGPWSTGAEPGQAGRATDRSAGGPAMPTSR